MKREGGREGGREGEEEGRREGGREGKREREGEREGEKEGEKGERHAAKGQGRIQSQAAPKSLSLHGAHTDLVRSGSCYISCLPEGQSEYPLLTLGSSPVQYSSFATPDQTPTLHLRRKTFKNYRIWYPCPPQS